MLVTIEMTDEMVAAECVCSAIGGWVLSTVSMPCVRCLQPAFDKLGKRSDYAVGKMEVLRLQRGD